ncbi:hypothetical protein BDE02_16G111800 [Populus trichocarpa]|jgi:hypothetical protein|nr:hypothetical protein BDE02_16G111800 [Populus trichocarpa]
MATTKQLMVPATWGIRSSFHSLIALLVAFLVIASIYVTQNSGVLVEDRTKSKSSGDLLSRCNLFSGKWVFDNKSYPLYKEKECTFMSDQLACEKFGRKDLNYQNWRWQPHQCDLPRYKLLYLSTINLQINQIASILLFFAVTDKIHSAGCDVWLWFLSFVWNVFFFVSC